MSRNSFDPRLLGSMVMMTAIVFVLTRVIQVPTPIVGYIHLGDVGIFFSALAFGPLVGGVAGGLGTALADWTSPYAQWGIFSLLIHGAQGWVAGWLVMKLQGVKGIVAAAVAGCIIVVGGYLLAGWILVGLAAALTEIPLNVVQVITGAVISIPLFAAIRQAYPPILRFGQRRQ